MTYAEKVLRRKLLALGLEADRAFRDRMDRGRHGDACFHSGRVSAFEQTLEILMDLIGSYVPPSTMFWLGRDGEP